MRAATEMEPSRSLPRPALTGILQPQGYGETRVDQASWDGRHFEADAQSIVPTISRAPDLPLAPIQRAVGQTVLGRSAPSDSTSEVVQREGPDSVSPAVGAVPSSSASASAVGLDDTPGVPGPASGPWAPPATKTIPQESDMDELANKLYDRIRIRLKTELLVARERAGMLTDWR
jgi:hypothetical protein